MSHVPKELVRCEYIFPSGRRCRQVRVKPGANFCVTHWQREQQQADAERIGDEIVGAEGALDTQEGIHKALSNVFSNLARNRISARNAAVLGYVGQLMLISRPSMEQTIKSLLPVVQIATRAAEQKEKSNAAEGDRLRKHALLELELFNGSVELFKTFREMSPKEGLEFMKFVRTFADKKEVAPGAGGTSGETPPQKSKAA